jgi:hypothetical protein
MPASDGVDMPIETPATSPRLLIPSIGEVMPVRVSNSAIRLQSLRRFVVTLLTSLAAFLLPSVVTAEVITYTWYNAPTVQQNDQAPITTKTLSGSITVDTTSLTSIGSGQWRIGTSDTSSITAWDFSVTGGAASYSSSSVTTDAFITIAGGGIFSLVASRSRLSVEGGASFVIGDSPTVSTTSILWDNGNSAHQYFSNVGGNQNPNGWNTTGEATLDAAFVDDGFDGWVIANAVPEPSTFAMGMCGVVAVAWDVYRRRRHAGSDSRCRRQEKLRYHAHSENVKARLLG